MTANENEFSREETIFSDLAEARRIQAEVEQLLQTLDFSEKEVFDIKLAVEEALVNAIKHGNQLDPTKSVEVSYRAFSGRFEIRIADEGPGYDPDDVPDPTAPENLERPCGRGLFLIRHYMTEVTLEGRGNIICLTKVRKSK